MHNFAILLCLGVAAPLLMFAFLAFFGHRIGKPRAGWVAVAGVLISLALSTWVLVGWMGMSAGERTDAVTQVNANPFEWVALSIAGKSVPINFAVKLDSLTVAMYFMVTLVSTCIFIFSIGYMAGHSDEVDGQSKYHRFFAYLSLLYLRS